MTAKKKPKKRPWYPHYVEKFNSDVEVMAMSWAERGFYRFLLDLQWLEGGIPSDRKKLARLAGMGGDQFEAELAGVVDACFGPVDGDASVLQNPTMERIRAEQDKVSSRQSKKAHKSHDSGSARQAFGTTNLKSETLPSEEKVLPSEGGTAAPPASQLPAQQQQVLTACSTPPPPEKKPKQNDVGRVIARYCALWVERHRPEDGRPPRLAKSDSGQAARLVREHGVDQAIAYVERFVADPDQWLFDQRHPLSLIGRQVNRYRATTAPPPQRSRFAPPSPTATTRENRSYSTPVEEVLRDYENIDVSPPTAEWREQMERLERRAAIAGDA
jgi:uncharacterized protein YdaU (DUF1376 family)